MAKALVALAAALVLAACSSLRTHVSVEPDAPADRHVDGRGPGRATLALLSQLRRPWQPEECAAILGAVAGAPLPEAQRAFALTELSLAAAATRRCPLSRPELLIDAARRSYGLMTASGIEDHAPPVHRAMRLYNRAVAELLTGADCCAPGKKAASLAEHAAALGIDIESGSLDLAQRFDRVLDADSMKITGLLERHRRFGAGAALVGVVSAPERSPARPRSMEAGEARALTALLHFDAPGTPRLSLYDSAHATVCLAQRATPLNADFTAPYAWLLGHSRQRAVGLLGAFLPERVVRERGLILLEPFDPRKIPVLMIHGFGSSPQAWRNITNELLASHDLRQRFQVWHYLYPTGLTYLYSAGVLRTELAELLAQLRRDHGADSVRPLVVIGHSQGGLLARALVTRSDSQLWNLLFRVPAESLAVEPPIREAFRNTLLFEPSPDIGTVLFMATPNSGMSSTTSSLTAWLLNVLIDLPDRASDALRRLRREHPEQLHEIGRHWFAHGGMTVIESVEADNPLMRAFARLPLAQGRHYHSIIAVRSAAGRVDSTDGYVSLDSAHVPEAESELIVRGGHRDTDGPEVVAEIRRVLRAHASRSSGTPASDALVNPCGGSAAQLALEATLIANRPGQVLQLARQ